ncbi:MAG TPA: PAS domain-containing sensor histidine kinase, partial [Acidimicrobiales bacterium]
QLARGGLAVPRHETTRITKNGLPVDVALTISPIRDENGDVVALSTIGRDLTEQRWLAETLNTTLARLEAALADARTAEERSRRFLADAAHQLRSPISGVRACAETLLRGPVPQHREELLSELGRETSRASRLITSLLRLARLDQGEQLTTSPVDVHQICEHELDRARLFVSGLDLTLRAGSPPPIVADVEGDSVQEMLANLLDNARRHARSRISLTITAGDAHLEIRVENDGPPVDPAMRNEIFERFVSLDSNGGSGLGLPIARELARAHGGDLVYRAGAFILTLPVGQGAPIATPSEHDGVRVATPTTHSAPVRQTG